MIEGVAERIWIKAVWGFDPENDGYFGFTKSGDRDRFFRESEPDDFILLYGADTSETFKEFRRQALGFIQIEPSFIKDTDRLSELGKRRKIENKWTERWTYAFPVKRAWKITRKIEIKHIASSTLTHQRARTIASRGELLSISEVEVAKQLPVIEQPVFGQPKISNAPANETALKSFFPSRGINPVIGTRQVEIIDGECFLYMFKLDGKADLFLDQRQFSTYKKVIVKIGYSNNPSRRCEELNSSLPPASIIRWKLFLRSAAFEDGASAKAAEDALKLVFAGEFESLGNEFFLGDESRLQSLFSSHSRAAFVIKT